jgi:hypothetical protein
LEVLTLAATVGLFGKLTSWAGTINTDLIENQEVNYTLNYSFDDRPYVPFGASGVVFGSRTVGRSFWDGTVNMQLATVQTGNLGSVTFANGYVANAYKWTMDIVANVHEVTPFGVTAKTWMPGVITATGTYSAIIDDTTALSAPGVTGTATFSINDGAGEKQLSGTVFVTVVAINVDPESGQANVDFSYAFSGSITTAGTGSYLWDAGASTITTPVAGSLVLQAHTSRTFTGSAFWKKISIVNDPRSSLVTLAIDYQGTGALTIA